MGFILTEGTAPFGRGMKRIKERRGLFFVRLFIRPKAMIWY